MCGRVGSIARKQHVFFGQLILLYVGRFSPLRRFLAFLFQRPPHSSCSSPHSPLNKSSPRKLNTHTQHSLMSTSLLSPKINNNSLLLSSLLLQRSLSRSIHSYLRTKPCGPCVDNEQKLLRIGGRKPALTIQSINVPQSRRKRERDIVD